MLELIKEKIPYTESNIQFSESLNGKISQLAEIPAAKKMELEGLEDLINLISSVMSNDFSLYHYKCKDLHIYFVYVVIHDFYNYRGIPLLIYAETDVKPNLYLKYRPDRNPQITMTNKVEEASAAYVKIIRVKKLPSCLGISS